MRYAREFDEKTWEIHHAGSFSTVSCACKTVGLNTRIENMKEFIAFVVKEFHHIFRDTRTLVVLFGMPIAQLLLFGYAISTEVNSAKIAVYDPHPDSFSRELTEKLVSSGFFQLADNVSRMDEIQSLFSANKVKLVVVYPSDFQDEFNRGEARVQLVVDGSDPNLAGVLSSSASAIIQKWAAGKMIGAGSLGTINAEVRWHYNPSLQSASMFVPGVVTIILMLVSAMLTSISITREKELGTIEILLVSPLNPLVIILGKVTPFVILSFFNVVLILGVANVVFNVPVAGSLFLLFAQSMLFTITSLALGVLISTISETQQTALMLSLFALMLPTILLSGFIFPVSNMPLVLQIISNIIPAKWFLIIIKGVMLQGVGLMYLWKETLVLLGMMVFFIGLSIRKFKIRLQ
jgi:ABC-2 type transport system permease protein